MVGGVTAPSLSKDVVSKRRPGVSAMLAPGLCFLRNGPSSTLLLRAANG